MNGSFNNKQDDYDNIIEFVREHNGIRYSRFDGYTIKGVNLFAIRENFDFDGLEEILDVIIKNLPAIKRIFARPIIRLEDINEIMPVETVKVMNNRTIIHASGHSELWDDLTESGLKPKKLMTISHVDSYVIYENVAFAKVVNIIRAIVRRNIRILRDMMYHHRDMHFNILERENHLEYFLAVGKLHIGYVRDYDKYRPIAERCLGKLLFIDDVIRSRLGSIVYKKCREKTKKFTLKKTNIFRNHKDYYRIYKLLDWFSQIKIQEHDEDEGQMEVNPEGYHLFVRLITLFGIGHFNYVFSDDDRLDFYNLDVTVNSGPWTLRLETVKADEATGISFTFSKDKEYRIILLPSHNPELAKKQIGAFREKYTANEYLVALPDGDEGDHIYISLFDIDSFRRIQQILLRGMIFSDTEGEVCPFCGGKLFSEKGEFGDIRVCKNCRTCIEERDCNVTGEKYTTTRIDNFTTERLDVDGVALRDRQLYMRKIEASMHFRNITPIKEGGQPVCPRCGAVH